MMFAKSVAAVIWIWIIVAKSIVILLGRSVGDTYAKPSANTTVTIDTNKVLSTSFQYLIERW